MVSWTPVYAFNWTTDIPADGMTITASGNWMPCSIGHAVDIDPSGRLIASAAWSDPSSMTIGVNNYDSPSANGIRIVIAAQNEKGGFDIIFVDPCTIRLNGSARFQPLEQVQWWYEAGAKQGTMLTSNSSTKQATKVETADFSFRDLETYTYTKKTSFDYQTNTWTTSDGR